jgi:hypothetical protein
MFGKELVELMISKSNLDMEKYNVKHHNLDLGNEDCFEVKKQ